ncbi:MAG: LptF/LptG family permease [Candidatus Omnitrophota bacterium]
MKILRTYILKEIIGPLLISISIFTFLLLTGNMLKLADMIVNKGVSILYIGRLFILLIPYVLSYTIPMSLLTATMICFGRLSSDNELTAMRATGISFYSIAAPVLILGLIISLGGVYLNDRILPASHFKSYKLIKKIGVEKPTAYLEAGTFIKSFKGYIVFIHSIDENKLNDIRIYQLQNDGPTRTIVAESGEIITQPEKNIVKLKLNNGTADEPNPSNPSIFYKLNFRTYYMSLNLENTLNESQIEKKPKDMTIKELKDEISKFKSQKIDPTPLIIEIHRKIAMAFSSFIFVLVALPLAINTRRREKSVGFGMSIILLTIYYLLLIGGQALALKGLLTPITGIWLANILYFAAGTVMIFVITEK